MKLCLILSMLLLTGCATMKPNGQTVGRIPVGDDVNVEVPEVEEQVDEENQAVLDTAQNNIKQFPDVPHEDDKKVEQWVNYFTGRGRKWMQVYMERSHRYLPLMKAILKEYGLPEDLVYIAMIESGFASRIRSHAGAVGYWQFITATGRRYGLTINSLLDERRDPILSTHAAAKYLKDLYNIFGDWYLAFASYNGGENRVARSVVRFQTRDFFDLVENKKALHKETINYVPKYLAARMISKNPAKYGFENLEHHEPIKFEEIVAEKSVYLKRLAKEISVDYEELKNLNPQFTTEYAPKYQDKNLIIRVPPAMSAAATVALANSYIQNQEFLTKLQMANYGRVRVRRGDTLSTLARRYRTSVARLRDLNSMTPGSVLRSGKFIKVPLGSGYERDREVDTDRQVTKINTRLPQKRKTASDTGLEIKPVKKDQVYVVRRGDNLTRIAKKYRVSINELVAVNNIKRSSRINVGHRLIIPD